jgi:magnesium-transporting ATPase (P-type)
VLFCFVVAIFYGVFRNQSKEDYYYIDWTEYSSPVDSIIIFFTYFVLINTMIPISLIVSIEMVKLFQKYFIDKDEFMYSEWRDKMAEVKCASLNEELGQIEYVFSDKTGTLTKNIMEFKIATIDQHMFGDVALIAPKGSTEKPSTEPGFIDDRLKDLLRSGAGNQQLKQPIAIKNREGQEKITLRSLKDVANQYFTGLSIAHEVVIEKKDGKTKYQGPSPDEVSLVDAAKEMNYEFLESTQNSTTAKILGKT